VIKAGMLNERVTIQAPTEIRSPMGEVTLSWASDGTVWAYVEGLSSRDILQAQQANVVATHKIIIRYRASVTVQHRIVWRGKTLEIASVTERQHRTMMEMLVREMQ
jgi:SPP1 family predicted phage head-tail adaptor